MFQNDYFLLLYKLFLAGPSGRTVRGEGLDCLDVEFSTDSKLL
jgi:hypothetical protein